MKRTIFTAAAIAMLLFGCKSENRNDNASSEGAGGLENTRTDESEIEGTEMPVEVATGMDTTAARNAEVGAAGERDSAQKNDNESNEYGR